LRFETCRFLGYFFFFEAILIPIYVLILGWGYQPERLRAATIIFFYTIAASLPLLLGIIYFSSTTGSSNFSSLYLSSFIVKPIFNLIILFAFIVKFPIYLFHLWLPKAHVEAPVSGSIILAGILLKLGGYGICISALMGAICGVITPIFIILSLMGGGILAIIILRITDIKVAIAYSSVVHMSMVICSLAGITHAGVVGRI